MDRRQRIDLDGVTLSAAGGSGDTVALFRRRSVEGLVLSMPESADLVVGWEHVEAAHLDLASGTLSITFTAAFAGSANWLGGARTLQGRWTDRVELRDADGMG